MPLRVRKDYTGFSFRLDNVHYSTSVRLSQGEGTRPIYPQS